jgi:hypothetical protein
VHSSKGARKSGHRTVAQKRMGTEEELGRKLIARMQKEEMLGDEEAERLLGDGSVSRDIREGVGEMEKRSGKGEEPPSKSQSNFESLFLNPSVVDELELELLDDQSLL